MSTSVWKRTSQVLCRCAVRGSLRRRYGFHNIANSVVHGQYLNLSLPCYSGKRQNESRLCNIFPHLSVFHHYSIFSNTRTDRHTHTLTHRYQTIPNLTNYKTLCIMMSFIPEVRFPQSLLSQLHIKQMKNGQSCWEEKLKEHLNA